MVKAKSPQSGPPADSATLKAQPVARQKASIRAPATRIVEFKPPLRTAVDATFQNHAILRDAFRENLKGVQAESKAITGRVRAAWKWNPSQLPTEELARRNYVAPGGDLGPIQQIAIENGIEAIRSSKTKPAITLRNSDALKDLIKRTTNEDGSQAETIPLETLLNFITLKPDASPSPVYALCKAELEAQKMLDAIEGTPVVKQPSEATEADSTQELRDAEALVTEAVNLQMQTATSPETRLQYAVASRANQATIRTDMQTFELRTGASDVTSYHDFSNLQIAFAHVWTRIFDAQIESLGQELYHEYVKLKEFAGSDDPDLPVSTLEDLRTLMAEIRKVSQTISDDTPGDFRDGRGDANGKDPKSRTEWADLLKGGVRFATNPAGALIDAIIEALSTAGQKPQIYWKDFPGPLPQHYDNIEVSFEEGVQPPDMILIELQGEDPWKGIEFQEWDSPTASAPLYRFAISNAPGGTPIMPVPVSKLKNGLLEFGSQESPGLNLGRYLLGRLDEKLKGGMRVRFTWTNPN